MNIDKMGMNKLSLLKGNVRLDTPDAKKQEAVQQFESYFIQMMVREMRKTVPKGIFDSPSMSMFIELLDQSLAEQISQSGGMGFAEALERSLGMRGMQSSDLLSGGSFDQQIQNAMHGGNEHSLMSSMYPEDPLFDDVLPMPSISNKHIFHELSHKIPKEAPAVHMESHAAHNHTHTHREEEHVVHKESHVPVSSSNAKTSSIGDMVFPLEGRISSRFGMRTDPIHGKHKHHSGLDIAATTGTPIKAVQAGTVTFSGNRGGYGKVVIIDHGNGLESRYAHCSELNVEKGQFVFAGTEIAAVGSTGRSTGPHLHLEIRQDGKAVDPLDYLP